MDGITRIAAGEASDKVARMRFRQSANGRPDTEVIARQSRIALLAFQAFGSREAAREFLNTEDARLGGRPLEIVGCDDAGFDAISAALPITPGRG